MRLEDFFLLPKENVHRENDLEPGEVFISILLPPAAPGARSIHLKQGEKDSFDWPIADVAVRLELRQTGVYEKVSIILGAAAPVPHRARKPLSLANASSKRRPKPLAAQRLLAPLRSQRTRTSFLSSRRWFDAPSLP